MGVVELICKDLIFQRPGKGVILNHLNVAFSGGSLTLITGPTGAGKSTLLNLLGGILRPTSGEVWASGRNMSRLPAPQLDLWRREVGMVFQHLHLFPDLTVLENVLLPHVPKAYCWSDALKKADGLLDRMDITDVRHESVQSLSGGQRQRVAVVRALMAEPHYFLLDEPTSFQDDRQTAALLALLVAMAGEGACVVVCSHDTRLREAKHIFRNNYRLDNGLLEALS